LLCEHTVLAIARDIRKIEKNSNHLSKKAVNVKNVDELSQAVDGSDVVISAFNPGWTNPNIYEEFLEGSKAIEQAVKNSGVTRFIVVGGAGSLYLDKDTKVIDDPNFPAAIKPGARSEEHTSELQSRENLVCR